MNYNLSRFFFFIIFCFAFIFNTNAQQIVHLNSKTGLINGTINAFEKDSLGYMWIGSDQGIIRYSGIEFKNYDLEKYRSTTSDAIIDVKNINGTLYAISSSGSLFKYHYKSDRFEELLSLKNRRFLSFTHVNNSDLIIGLANGLVVYNLESKKSTNIQHPTILLNREVHYLNGKVYSATSKGLCVFNYNSRNKLLTFEKKYLAKEDIIDFAFDVYQRIWVGTEIGGLHIIQGNSIKNVFVSSTVNKTYAIRKIRFDNNNNALIAVDRLGLYVLNKDFKVIKAFSHNPNDGNTINQNSIYEIFVDSGNSYWLGVREGGINIIYEKDNVFTTINHIQNQANSIENNNIRSIFESAKGDLWFGTENGISKLAQNKQWTNYNKDPKLYNTAVLAVNEYQNSIILGTYGESVLALDQNTGGITKLNLEPKVPLKFVFSTHIDEDNLWFGGSDGSLVHYQNGKLVNSYSVRLVRSLVKGMEHTNYVGSSEGFFEINVRTATMKQINKETFNSFNEIHNLQLDYVNNCMWIGSKNGLYKYLFSSNKTEYVSGKSNKDLGTVFSVKKDNKQNLYLATIKGLWRYDIKRNLFRKFGSQDGLTIDEFGVGASAEFKDGRLAFGGAQGAVIFNPDKVVPDKPISDIYIANFQINGKEPDTITLPNNINFSKELVLKYDQNSISFNYEIIKFHGSKRYEFRWKLEGYDEEYKMNFGNEKVIYSNLQPGNYVLKVQGFNADGVKGEKEYQLKIKIRNPFWKTGWAFAIYILVTILIIYLIYRISKANNQKRFDESKIMFFIEVAHDIRTPVSLIQLLVKQLSNQENVAKSIELIQRNTENLNEYVTQLLDFQKIDRKQLKLSVTKVDLKDCLARIISDFTPIVEEKGLHIALDVKHIPVWFDKAKMSRIFYNLISNAIKYSHEGGEIKVKAYLSDKYLRIDFIDQGIGVPEKQQELIFNRFTRGTNVTNKGIPGTGIGLMLSKKIVELHGGQILLESQENVGSKFSVILPIGTEHYDPEDIVYPEPVQEQKATVNTLINKNKLILLVEDNTELREAIKNELEKNYTIIEAANGKEGLLLALSKNPDLVITDVMMPEMDGKELCNLLKTNFKTSHIPVIMLTALAAVTDKIEGLETGADAYVEKPFNVEILKVTINNLIKSRENVRRILEDKEVKKQLTPEESFLSDVIEVIKNNLTENDFSIDNLAENMGLSRSNLFRKLKGSIQISPSDLIIKIKLSHAEELMRSKSQIRISDIAYQSGFQDPKYFSTLFKKHYGKTPTEFIEEFQ